MPEYRAPGVYVEEQSAGPTPIQGVGTSTAGFLGETERGSTEPQFLSSLADFERKFGGFKHYRDGERLAGTFLAYAVEGFFRNGGTSCYVGRIEAEDMPTADAALGPVPPPAASQAGVLGATPETVDFGTVPIDVPRVRTVTLTNRGAAEDPVVAVEDVSVADDTAGEFEVVVTDAEGATVTPSAADPHEVAQGATSTVTLTYTPTDDSLDEPTLVVTHDGTDSPLEVPLTAQGLTPAADTLRFSTDAVDLGDVPLGVAATAEVTLMNAGGPAAVAIPITGLTLPTTLTGELDVELLGPDGTPADPTALTLEAGEVATLVVEYTPTEPGAESDTITVSHGGNAAAPDPAPGDVSPFEIAFAVTGGSLELDREAVAFGAVGVETAAAETVRLTNRNDPADGAVEVSAVAVQDDADGVFEPAVFDSNGDPVDLDAAPHDVDPDDFLDVQVTFEPPAAEEYTATLRVTHDGPTSPTDVPLSGTGGVLELTAVGPGVWGENVAVVVEAGSLSKPDNELFKLTLRYWATDADARLARNNDADTDIDAVPDPDHEEVYDNLSPEESSPDYYRTRVDGVSELVEVTRRAAGRPGEAVVWLDGPFPDALPTVDRGDYQGETAAGERTGLAAFEEVDDINIVCVPDEVDPNLDGLTGDVEAHCSTVTGDRVAVLQAPRTYFQNQPNEMEPSVDSDFAAFYYPWIRVVDPETNERVLVPPGGHVAGIYARSDGQRGVHKAPANEIVRGAMELQVPITQAEQAILNPKGINCIRSFPGRGIRVWGARTTSSDPLWRYLNVRRVFLFIEESIDEGTQYAVFEPNDEALWARVRQSVRNFLTTVWRNGALMGTTPEEAFYVRCDRTTMTQAEIDNGQLIVEIGVAVVKPAEFVVFRIAQTAGGGEGG